MCVFSGVADLPSRCDAVTQTRWPRHLRHTCTNGCHQSIWPTLPIVISGRGGLVKDADNIIAALEHHDRICRIALRGVSIWKDSQQRRPLSWSGQNGELRVKDSIRVIAARQVIIPWGEMYPESGKFHRWRRTRGEVNPRVSFICEGQLQIK